MTGKTPAKAAAGPTLLSGGNTRRAIDEAALTALIRAAVALNAPRG